jgi:hypothetical protein
MFQFVQKFVAGVKAAVRSARENAQRILSAAKQQLTNARTISLAACRRMSAGLQTAPAVTVEAGRQGGLIAARWLASVAGLTVLCLLAVIAFLARGLMLAMLVVNLAIGQQWALLGAVTDRAVVEGRQGLEQFWHRLAASTPGELVRTWVAAAVVLTVFLCVVSSQPVGAFWLATHATFGGMLAGSTVLAVITVIEAPEMPKLSVPTDETLRNGVGDVVLGCA